MAMTIKVSRACTYLDAGSRGTLPGDGTCNVVLYKGTDANITHRNGTQINGEPVVPEESTGGAAAVHDTTLEDETFAKGGAWIGKNGRSASAVAGFADYANHVHESCRSESPPRAAYRRPGRRHAEQEQARRCDTDER